MGRLHQVLILDQTMLMIPGSGGALETRYHCLPSQPNAPIALIIPPHPEQEGSMDHPVIHALFRTFARLEFNVLRFNFRGCGQSQGTFVNGSGSEVSDAATCLDWLQNKNLAPSQCWVVGYSFGAYVALQLLMRRPECFSFVAVSPLASMYDFSFLAPCPAPGLVVHGEMSDLTPRESVVRLVHQLSMQKRGHRITLSVVPQADHSYTDKLASLEAVVHNYVTQSNSAARQRMTKAG